VNKILELRIDGFCSLEDYGKKADGTQDMRVVRGYKILLVENRARILFEETLPREKVPANPTQFLARRVADILTPYLPRIDPEELCLVE
jgi:hypothetical protein